MVNEDTAGEELIREFFEERGIDATIKQKVPNLTDDNKFFREADFYLHRYDVYVEFLGQWNNYEHQKRYRQKMAVYYKNNIPCVYLWPDNLGTLDWMFKRRLRETLLKYNKKWSLIKFEFDNLMKEHGFVFLILILAVFLVKGIVNKLTLLGLILFILADTVYKEIKKLRNIKKSRFATPISDQN